MENKKTIIGIVIVLILIIGLIVTSYYYSEFNKNQMNLLTEESNKIIQSNIATDDIDFNIKTKKKYAVVEKAIKEYVLKLKNIFVEMQEMNESINPNGIFSAQNMQDKDFSEVESIINEYKEKSQNCITQLQELITEEKITENINTREISNRKKYYIDLYNTVMLGDAMKNQYSVLEEKVKDERSKINEKLNKINRIKEFLEENKNSWTIKDDKIQFNNLNRMTEYYNLVNQLID